MVEDGQPNIQQQQSRLDYVKQYINECYEQIRDDRANPPVQPEIQLMEGWRNGNIKIGTGAPTKGTGEHTWDIYLEIPDTVTDDWELVTNVYVRKP